MSDPSRAEFRADINGLRALAVVAVIFYHFNIPGFGGGFAGVDVFFGISGYLMTGIVVSGLMRGDFSIWKFYMARARRIVPALLVLCAVLLIVGWWVLPAQDYLRLGLQVLYSVAFCPMCSTGRMTCPEFSSHLFLENGLVGN